MPSTGMPSAIFASICWRFGNSCCISRARWRTGALSSSSRLGGSSTEVISSSSERWSATANGRIWSTSSPKNSTRTGWSETGGKTSRMPPRTANSPRRVTMSTREYARSTSRTASSERSCPRLPVASCTGASSVRLSATGWRAARTDATMTSGRTCSAGTSRAPWPSAACHCSMRRSAWIRLPTISALGLSRSCGSVSQAGNSRISASGSTASRLRRIPSDSRPVAVTTSRHPGMPRWMRWRRSPASSGPWSPSVREKSASREADARASSNVEARESAGIKPWRITR